MYNAEFLKNFPLGVFLGSVLSLLLCAAFDSEIRDDITKLYTFVFSALIALLAASVALSGVLASLQHQNEILEKERERKLLATRALMPQVLSDVCDIARRGMINCKSAGQSPPKGLDQEFVDNSILDIAMSDEMMSIFRDLIEFSTGTTAKRIQGILSEHQVFQSRWRSHVIETQNIMYPKEHTVAERFTEWAYLGALAASAFPYARGESDQIDVMVTAETILSISETLGGLSLQTPEIKKTFAQVHAESFARKYT